MTYLNAVDLYASVEALSFGVMSGHIVATRLLRCHSPFYARLRSRNCEPSPRSLFRRA